jgi:hypothetical protein
MEEDPRGRDAARQRERKAWERREIGRREGRYATLRT